MSGLFLSSCHEHRHQESRHLLLPRLSAWPAHRRSCPRPWSFRWWVSFASASQDSSTKPGALGRTTLSRQKTSGICFASSVHDLYVSALCTSGVLQQACPRSLSRACRHHKHRRQCSRALTSKQDDLYNLPWHQVQTSFRTQRPPSIQSTDIRRIIHDIGEPHSLKTSRISSDSKTSSSELHT